MRRRPSPSRTIPTHRAFCSRFPPIPVARPLAADQVTRRRSCASSTSVRSPTLPLRAPRCGSPHPRSAGGHRPGHLSACILPPTGSRTAGPTDVRTPPPRPDLRSVCELDAPGGPSPRSGECGQALPGARGAIFRRAVAQVRAVENVSFTLDDGRDPGAVGESGCEIDAGPPRDGVSSAPRVTSASGEEVTPLSRARCARCASRSRWSSGPYGSTQPTRRVGSILAIPSPCTARCRAERSRSRSRI